MYNYGNSGYVGQSRSKRSDEAIENGEVPISMIKLSFLEEHFQNDEIDIITNFGVSNFKKLAIQLGANSWHHTGKYYNETDHYNVYDVYDRLVKMTTEEKILFKEENKEVKKEIEELKYGFITQEIWGGTRKYPKIIGEQTRIGKIKGDWLITREGKKCKISANKTIKSKSYDTLIEAKKGIKKELGIKVLKKDFEPVNKKTKEKIR